MPKVQDPSNRTMDWWWPPEYLRYLGMLTIRPDHSGAVDRYNLFQDTRMDPLEEDPQETCYTLYQIGRENHNHHEILLHPTGHTCTCSEGKASAKRKKTHCPHIDAVLALRGRNRI